MHALGVASHLNTCPYLILTGLWSHCPHSIQEKRRADRELLLRAWRTEWRLSRNNLFFPPNLAANKFQYAFQSTYNIKGSPGKDP